MAYLISSGDETLHAARFEHATKDALYAPPVAVPHLQRPSPSGRWFAAFDAASSLVRVWSTQEGGSSFVRPLVGVTGRALNLRWLRDGAGVVLHTTDGLWRVPLVSGEARRLGERTDVVDYRMLPGRILVRTSASVVWLDPSSGVERGLGLDLGPVRSASPLSGDRVALVVGELRDARLLVVDLSGPQPTIEAEKDCPDGCDAVNWTPGSRLPTVALPNGTIWQGTGVVDGRLEVRSLRMRETGFDRVHTLWQSPDGRRILAASAWALKIWDARTGDLLDRIDTSKRQIRSARFDDGGVLITWDDAVVRRVDGRDEVLLDRKAARRLGLEKGGFLDDTHRLASGALAVAVVRVTRTWGSKFAAPPADLLGLRQ